MIIIDNFVKDQDLLQRIANDPTFFEVGYSWWNGWWTEGSEPRAHKTVYELIKYIWRDHTPEDFQGVSVAGFEHWAGRYDAADLSHKTDQSEHNVQGHPIFSLIHHMDKDEAHWSNTGEIVTPTVGTVFYPIDHKCTGGSLRIYDTHDVDLHAPYEVIAPKFNRLIIFDAGQLHAVEEVTSGVRKAIAINLWGSKLSDEQMDSMNVIL